MGDKAFSVDRDNVEAAFAPVVKSFTEQVVLSYINDGPLLSSVYVFFAAAVGPGAAVFDLDEHQGISILHDEVDFSAPDAEIGLSQTVSFRLQITAGFLFKASADLSFVQLFLSGGNGRKQGGNAVLCFR